MKARQADTIIVAQKHESVIDDDDTHITDTCMF